VSIQQFTKSFIGLPAFHIVNIVHEHNRWVAILRPKHIRKSCPICGLQGAIHGRSKTRTLMHRYSAGWGILWVRVPIIRGRCHQCNITWTLSYPGIPEGRTLGIHSFVKAAALACHRRDIKSVSKEWRIPYTTLERWYYQWAPSQLPKPPQDTPPVVVCMDEFSIRKNHKYAVALMDFHTRHVWHVGQGKVREDIQATIKGWPFTTQPRAVVTDLVPGMAKTIKTIWPKADVIADKFHVLNLLFRKLDQQRKQKNTTSNHC